MVSNVINMAELLGQVVGRAVLVTGASGFIGAHLCDRLLAYGAEVHAVSRQARRSGKKHLQWWQADLRDQDAVRGLVKATQPQIVFHMSSCVVGSRTLEAVVPTFHDNLASTVHLLTAATDAGCERIVLANSSEEPQKSDEHTFPCSPYAAAKWASSMYGRMFHQLFQTPVVIPRIFMTYGPDQKDLKKLVPFVVCQLLRGESPQLSGGKRQADWIYVDDVIEGLLRAALVPGLEGCTFDLGSGLLTSVRGIVEQLVEIVGGGVQPAFGALPDRPFEQERAADTSFLSTRLGYQPTTSLHAGLEATVAWYREQLDAVAQ
jgi:UDP-glucose 4-epimerase